MFNGVSFKRLYESHGPINVCRVIHEAIMEGAMKAEDFSLAELAKTFMGEQWYENLRPEENGGFRPMVVFESEGSATNTSAFQNIVGQVIFSGIMQGYQEAPTVVDSFIRVQPTRRKSQKLYGTTGILGDIGERVVREGENFPEYSLGEDWIQTPETEKRGGIISITRELIFFDETGLVVGDAKNIGKDLAYNRRLRWIDVMIGFVNNYNLRGTTYNTYLTSGNWINKKTGVELLEWADIDEAEALASDLVEPYRDRPMAIEAPRTMIVMPPKKATARRLLAAGSLTVKTNSGNTEQESANPYAGEYRLVVDQLIYQREKARNPTNAGTRWYIGNPENAFGYMENWGIGVRVQGVDSEVSFQRDIELRYRADERGVAFVRDPRQMFQLNQ